MAYVPRPHTSAAFQHLRLWITAFAGVLAVALTAQILVWSFVHFTDVRTKELAPASGASAPVVVASSPESGTLAADRGVDPNTVQSAGDIKLRRIAALVQTVGVLSCLILMVLMMQGVSIAGGSNVPGLEMAVTASTWVLIISALSLPLGKLLPEVAYPGVFLSYESLVAESAAVRTTGSGGFAFFGLHLFLPLLMIAGLAASVLRFRAGVEHGVIVTNVSQLDEKVENEIRSMKLGQLSSPRSVGALNQAIGDDASHPSPSPMQKPQEAPGRPI